MVVVTKSTCTNCGAPLSVGEAQRHVICTYCNVSLRVDAVTAATRQAAATVQLTTEAVSKDDIERLKRLVLEGKRDEAVAHYERAAKVTRAEAEQAVNMMLVSEFWTFTRRAPLNAFGFLLYGIFIGGGGALAAWSALQIPESPGFIALAVLGAAFAVWQFVRFVPKLISTWVHNFGAEGRARVLHRAVLRTDPARAGSLVQVMFEVEPSSGGSRFTDEEILFVRDASLPKLEIGNVVLVRYDEPGHTRVFPAAPITVVATGGGYRG